MSKTSIPKNYHDLLGLYDTQRAIGIIKTIFQEKLCAALHLKRVTAPLFVLNGSGLNDDLNGVERPVSFDVPCLDERAEVVHSLAKWKRYALAEYGFRPGQGLVTDMNAIRRDEELDNLHSIYVDQWDWEKVITAKDRTLPFLQETVRDIVDAVCSTADELRWKFPELKAIRLTREPTFITTQELEDLYPDLTPKERENAFTRAHGTVCIMQIGGQLNLAVVSPGKQEMCKWLTHLNYRAKKAGVKFEFKKEATVENVKEFAPDAVIVATGATPLIPTFIKGVGDYPVITTHDILSRKVTIPKGTVCILGGGEVACETAEMIMADARPNSFATTGSIGDVEVTLVEMQPQLMTGVCLPNRNIALASLRREGVKSYINSKVLEVTEHDVKIQHKDGSEEWLKGFDYIILGLGSRKYDPLSEELKAFVPEVHVIGDAVKPGQSSDAMHQGFHIGYEL